jgi:putative tricarboxylic transport membrane protein
VQSWTIGAATNNLFGMFFGRPISQGILAFTLITLFLPIFLARKNHNAVVGSE